MKEILNRINKMYLNNAHRYYNDFDNAVYMFLNIAFMRETTRNKNEAATTLDDVQKLLTEAVEAAVIAYEADGLLDDDEDNENKKTSDVEALRETAENKYKTARGCVDFGNKKNSHFRAAAENVIGMGITRHNLYISQGSRGCARDVYKAYRSICKDLK